MAAIIVSRVVKTLHEMPLTGKSKVTVGERVDQVLASAAREGHQVQTLTLELTPEDWHTYGGAFPQSNVERGEYVEMGA